VRATWTCSLHQAVKGKKSPRVLTPQGGGCLIRVIILQRCTFPHKPGLKHLKEMGIATLAPSKGEQQPHPQPSILEGNRRFQQQTQETFGKRKLSRLLGIILYCSLILSCFFLFSPWLAGRNIAQEKEVAFLCLYLETRCGRRRTSCKTRWCDMIGDGLQY